MLTDHKDISGGGLFVVLWLAAVVPLATGAAESQEQSAPAGQASVEEPAPTTLELRYKPEPNGERLYSFSATGPAAATFEDGTTLASFEVQLSADLMATVTQINEETFVISVAVQEPKADISGIELPMEQVGDARLTVELTRRGKIVSTDLGESLLQSLRIRGLDAALLPALLSALELPEQPVGVGGSWESEVRTGAEDAGLVARTKSTLTEAAVERAKITCDASIDLPAMELTVMDFPLQVQSGGVTLEKLVVDFDHQQGVPLGAEGLLHLSLRANFQDMPLEITADLKVKVAPSEPVPAQEHTEGQQQEAEREPEAAPAPQE